MPPGPALWPDPRRPRDTKCALSRRCLLFYGVRRDQRAVGGANVRRTGRAERARPLAVAIQRRSGQRRPAPSYRGKPAPDAARGWPRRWRRAGRGRRARPRRSRGLRRSDRRSRAGRHPRPQSLASRSSARRRRAARPPARDGLPQATRRGVEARPDQPSAQWPRASARPLRDRGVDRRPGDPREARRGMRLTRRAPALRPPAGRTTRRARARCRCGKIPQRSARERKRSLPAWPFRSTYRVPRLGCKRSSTEFRLIFTPRSAGDAEG